MLHNFGLQIHFHVGLVKRAREGLIEILAHLIQPAEFKNTTIHNGHHTNPHYCLSAMFVDPSVLQQPWDRLKARFETAMRELELEVKLSGYNRGFNDFTDGRPYGPVYGDQVNSNNPRLGAHQTILFSVTEMLISLL